MKRVRKLLILASLSISAASNSVAHAGIDATVGADTTAFLYQRNGFGESIFPSVGARVSGVKEWSVFTLGGDAFARVFLSKSTPYYFDAPEAYIATTAGVLGNFQLSFGRRKIEWSRGDEAYHLGIFAPRFRWDPITPETVGLTGFYAHYKSGIVSAQLFGSPIFLPEQGAPVNFNNGQITAVTPFSMSAISQVNVIGTDTPVKYDVPSADKLIGKILLNPAFSTRLKIGNAAPPTYGFSYTPFDAKESDAIEGGWGAAAYAYKPMNQLLMQMNYSLRINAAPNYISIPIMPRVAYHHLGALEGGYEWKQMSLWGSLLGEVPVEDQIIDGWTAQQVAPSIMGVAGFEYRFGQALSDSPRARISVLAQRGGNTADRNPPPMGGLSGGGSSLFENRYPFQTAAQAQFWTPLPFIPRQIVGMIVLDTRLLVDIGHDGLISSTGLTFRPTKHWNIGVSADFLVTGITRYTGDSPSDFIGRFQENSRVQAGVNYVF